MRRILVARKLSLPMHGKALDLLGPPTVDTMRTRLGGRSAQGSSEVGMAGVGDVVRLGDADPPRPGVVIARDPEVVDVYVDLRTVRRTRPLEVRPWLGELSSDLVAIARDARSFAALTEGQEVRFTSEHGEPQLGTLREKCRWGALVECPDGKVVGIGFRRVLAVEPGSAAS